MHKDNLKLLINRKFDVNHHEELVQLKLDKHNIQNVRKQIREKLSL